jgi:hypothetical protein
VVVVKEEFVGMSNLIDDPVETWLDCVEESRA